VNKIDAMVALVKGTKMSRAYVVRLKCSDLSVGGSTLSIEIGKKRFLISDYSLVYPIVGYLRERIVEAGNPDSSLFGMSSNTISRHFKKATGCTIKEYNDTKV